MNYTSKEQSKKLVELGLNPETADMFYSRRPTGNSEYSTFPDFKPEGRLEVFTKVDLPCWSLGALLEVIPDSIKDRELLIHKTPYQNTMMWEIGYGYNEIDNRISKSLLNAVYNTVIWLLENGHLKE